MMKLLMVMVLLPLMALADMEIVNGVEWAFTISGGKATVGVSHARRAVRLKSLRRWAVAR